MVRRAAPDAFGLLGGTVVLLIIAGLIEAHITPHFPAWVRWSVAAASALFLIVYFGWGGRRPDPVGAGFSQQAAGRNLEVAVDHGRRDG